MPHFYMLYDLNNEYQMAYTLFVVKLNITFTNFIFHNTYFSNKKMYIFFTWADTGRALWRLILIWTSNNLIEFSY